MADVAVAFAASPVVAGEQTAFVEGVIGNGESTIELDLGGKVRLSAIAFESGFAGAVMTVKATVPWAAADVEQLVDGFTITVKAGEVVQVPYTDTYYLGKILLTVDTNQTADKKIGFFGWRGGIE